MLHELTQKQIAECSAHGMSGGGETITIPVYRLEKANMKYLKEKVSMMKMSVHNKGPMNISEAEKILNIYEEPLLDQVVRIGEISPCRAETLIYAVKQYFKEHPGEL